MIMMKRYKKILLTGVLSALSCSFVHAQELYKNENAPVHERVMDLISRLTVEEKISLLRATSPGIPRLGIDKYYHGNEALHGVVRPGRFTVFPQAIGLAATWNPELQKRVATVISDEARARWNELDQGREQKEQFSDVLTFWSPTVNMARDPRWGRTPETYGEDPFLSGIMGTAFVNENILNDQTIRTGGYEQMRLSRRTYVNKEGAAAQPIQYYVPFDSKYFYLLGTTYYLNVYFRF